MAGAGAGARAMNAMSEILPARRMWNRGLGFGEGSNPSTLPVSVRDQKYDQRGLRKRIGSISMGDGSRSESSWSFRRNSSSVGECASALWKCWEWGWGWISSRRTNTGGSARMGSEDDRESMLACGRAIGWKHLFFKLKAELRKMVQSTPATVPHRFKYDALSYAQNFDDGEWQQDQEAQPIPPVLPTKYPSANPPGIGEPCS